MSKLKNIYWRPDLKKNDRGEMYANIHILVGYNQGSISDLQKMADEVRQTFPQATYEDICAGKVTSSERVKGFTIVTWSAYIPKGDYLGWTQFHDGKMEYCW